MAAHHTLPVKKHAWYRVTLIAEDLAGNRAQAPGLPLVVRGTRKLQLCLKRSP